MPSVATITDNNTGTAAFTVRITYDHAMNTGLNPAVTFSPDVATTLTYNRAQNWWVSNTAFVARYDVADANVAVANVGINVAGAVDATGNVQTPYSGTNNFSIDTLGAAPAPAGVVSATPNVALVTDNNLGTATFAIRITYDHAMNTNRNPAVTFTPDVSITLSYDRAWSWWVSSTAFVARYDVADANVVVPNITIGVTGAYDATGNVQAAYTGPNAFSIDTLNPPPGALPLRPWDGLQIRPTATWDGFQIRPTAMDGLQIRPTPWDDFQSRPTATRSSAAGR